MDEKKFLEELFGMLPEDCQDIYDDTIPEAKEVRAKMKGKKKAVSIPDYTCGYEMFEDIRALDYKSQAQVCKAFHQYLKKKHLDGFFINRFQQTYSQINMKNLQQSIEAIHYTVNDLDNAITNIDYYEPMLFFNLARVLAKIIASGNKVQGA